MQTSAKKYQTFEKMLDKYVKRQVFKTLLLMKETQEEETKQEKCKPIKKKNYKLTQQGLKTKNQRELIKEKLKVGIQQQMEIKFNRSQLAASDLSNSTDTDESRTMSFTSQSISLLQNLPTNSNQNNKPQKKRKFSNIMDWHLEKKDQEEKFKMPKIDKKNLAPCRMNNLYGFIVLPEQFHKKPENWEKHHLHLFEGLMGVKGINIEGVEKLIEQWKKEKLPFNFQVMKTILEEQRRKQENEPKIVERHYVDIQKLAENAVSEAEKRKSQEERKKLEVKMPNLLEIIGKKEIKSEFCHAEQQTEESSLIFPKQNNFQSKQNNSIDFPQLQTNKKEEPTFKKESPISLLFSPKNEENKRTEVVIEIPVSKKKESPEKQKSPPKEQSVITEFNSMKTSIVINRPLDNQSNKQESNKSTLEQNGSFSKQKYQEEIPKLVVEQHQHNKEESKKFFADRLIALPEENHKEESQKLLFDRNHNTPQMNLLPEQTFGTNLPQQILPREEKPHLNDNILTMLDKPKGNPFLTSEANYQLIHPELSNLFMKIEPVENNQTFQAPQQQNPMITSPSMNFFQENNQNQFQNPFPNSFQDNNFQQNAGYRGNNPMNNILPQNQNFNVFPFQNNVPNHQNLPIFHQTQPTYPNIQTSTSYQSVSNPQQNLFHQNQPAFNQQNNYGMAIEPSPSNYNSRPENNPNPNDISFGNNNHGNTHPIGNAQINTNTNANNLFGKPDPNIVNLFSNSNFNNNANNNHGASLFQKPNNAPAYSAQNQTTTNAVSLFSSQNATSQANNAIIDPTQHRLMNKKPVIQRINP